MKETKSTKPEIRLEQDGSSLRYTDLRAGDVLLYCPKEPRLDQQVISHMSGSPYTHAAIYLGEGMLAEALTIGGAQKNPLSSALNVANHVGVLRSQGSRDGFSQARAAQLNEFIEKVIDHGRWYDLKGALSWPYTNSEYLASQMEYIARHYGEFKTSDEIAKSAFFCSALVVACFTAVGIIDETAQVAYPPAATAPGGLYADPTFGWLLGFLVPEGNSVPDTDPLLFITNWSDIPN